ncbi:hypothetical protein [Coleofasciculus sp. B1-GNL1-01]|uniref:hypothetical protein n=1 Tax=Coleofasciculus sp. B1-GNL1-01 TaxID=3068484 RepID=UPI004064624E
MKLVYPSKVMPEDTYKQLLQAATARYHALLYQSYSQLSLDDKIFIENFRYYKQMSLNQVVQALDDNLRQLQGKDYWSACQDTKLFNFSIDQ